MTTMGTLASPLLRSVLITFFRVLLVCHEWAAVVLGHGAAQVRSHFFVAFVFDDAVLVKVCYQFTSIIRYYYVERDELGAQVVADAA